MDRRLIQSHDLAVQTILADLERGWVDGRAGQLANAVADILESCRMYTRASGQWVRDVEAVASWREIVSEMQALPATDAEARMENIGHYRRGEG